MPSRKKTGHEGSRAINPARCRPRMVAARGTPVLPVQPEARPRGGFLSPYFLFLCALFAVWWVAADPALADAAAEAALLDADGNAGSAAVNISTIGPALQRSTGVVTVNQAAGDGNVQQNSAALAESEGHSVATVDAAQALQQVMPVMDQLLMADIESGAFDDALGVYLVNQSAGGGNSQFNGAAIAVGGVSALAIVQLDDARLQEQSVGSAAPLLPEEGGAKVSASANLAPDAFAGARGLFLVNQAAGNNNTTANTFTMSASP